MSTAGREALHPGELGGSAAGDLLSAQLDQLLLEVLKLLLKVVFALAPELGSLNLSGRLHFVSDSMFGCNSNRGCRTILNGMRDDRAVKSRDRGG